MNLEIWSKCLSLLSDKVPLIFSVLSWYLCEGKVVRPGYRVDRIEYTWRIKCRMEGLFGQKRKKKTQPIRETNNQTNIQTINPSKQTILDTNKLLTPTVIHISTLPPKTRIPDGHWPRTIPLRPALAKNSAPASVLGQQSWTERAEDTGEMKMRVSKNGSPLNNVHSYMLTEIRSFLKPKRFIDN